MPSSFPAPRMPMANGGRSSTHLSPSMTRRSLPTTMGPTTRLIPCVRLIRVTRVSSPSRAKRRATSWLRCTQLTRSYDDDPYTDTFWGILTGFDAENALAIAQHDEPLVVRKVAGGTEVALEMCSEGKWFCELVAGKSVTKSEDGESEQTIGEADSTAAIVEALNSYQPDLFVTSGHATERDWQIGFRYRNGYFKSKAGQMTGLDTAGNKIAVDSTNPKVYLPIGNCLMGHIDGPDAMALAWMNDAGVKQMIGYTRADLVWLWRLGLPRLLR